MQPAQGYRAAIDPIFLAASIDIGGSILDAGCGTGAAALCLAVRCPDFAITGVELDPSAATFARENIALNEMADRIAIVETSFAAFARNNPGAFDQVMTNPPFYPQDAHTPSPRPGKAAAHGEAAVDLAGWIEAACVVLKPGGKLTLIHRADRIGDILISLRGRFGAAVIFPLWPRTGVEAKRILVSVIKGRRTPARLMAGLILHRPDGKFTAEADAILRDAQALNLEPLDLAANSA